jgi:acyl carrier protein
MQVDFSSKEKIFELIKEFLVNDFECDAATLKPETKLFEELDLDSIDAVDLIVKLQHITGKKIDPESFKQVRTVSDVTDAIYKLINQQ